MHHSTERILTTHAGSLPRSKSLVDVLLRKDGGEAVDPAVFERETTKGVSDVLRAQTEAGVDIVSDGEQARVSFSTYVTQRMRGFGGKSKRPIPRDHDDFPVFSSARKDRFSAANKVWNPPQAIAEIKYVDLSQAKDECDRFRAALEAISKRPDDAFMTAVAPGVIACSMTNAYYDSHASYLSAIAREMQQEYELVASYGYTLQIDSPDLALERARQFKSSTTAEFLKIAESHVEALNGATRNIPREKIRLHVCWGNWEGPHVHDFPLSELLPVLYQAKVGGLSIEFANPRHQHEYEALRRNPMPDQMVLIPGVICSKSNVVEHPELVANRICEAVAAVGDRVRVVAGTDCGFDTMAGAGNVTSDIAWAKLRVCREGADIASRRL